MTEQSGHSWGAACSTWIAALPALFVVISGLGLVAVIGWLDYQTGPDISMVIVYVLPIALIGWYVNRAWAAAMSCISAAIGFGVNLRIPPAPSLAVCAWNALINLGIFLIIAQTFCALRRALHQERRLARTDPLTGALNFRAFYEMAELERQRALRYQHPLTLLYIDADSFKTINAHWGRQAGDAALCRIAETLKSYLRGTDITARLAGDEFAVLLPETPPEAAQATAHKIRMRLLEEMQRAGWPLTFSLGVLTFMASPPPVDAMVAEADALMSAVKASGKNAMKYEIAVAPKSGKSS